jgi:uncharacterized membrane protein YjgN (DUF898 family)
MDLTPNYRGQGNALFSLAFKTGLLTVLTLGIYRFWQKTRIRKYIWSSTNLDGDGFEYTGTGLEKFLGFLLAIVILAVYLGLVQMALFFFGLNIFVDPETASQAEVLAQIAAIYISALAVMPLVYYAQYRARRYKMARTRWRSIRFGMDRGAWGYAFRAIGYGLLTIVSLGILTPLMTFKLEQYMADRSYYGSERFKQSGKWTQLYKAMLHMLIGLALLIASGATIFLHPYQQPGTLTLLLFFAGYIWFLIGTVVYFVQSFAYLMSHKTLGYVSFTATPRTGTIIKHYVLGGLAIGLILAVVFGMATSLISASLFMVQSETAVVLTMVGIVLIYLFVIVMMQALSLVMITQPILQHIIKSVTVHNTDALADIQQRAAEQGVDAEGFADALDIGAAI